MPATPQAARRKDAQRNREAILAAARELYAESADVPMYEVARRAGVGQGTLYRNFPDRSDLAAALIAEIFELEEQLAAEHAGDAYHSVVRRGHGDICRHLHVECERPSVDTKQGYTVGVR